MSARFVGGDGEDSQTQQTELTTGVALTADDVVVVVGTFDDSLAMGGDALSCAGGKCGFVVNVGVIP